VTEALKKEIHRAMEKARLLDGRSVPAALQRSRV
jgi:hypothetical protein